MGYVYSQETQNFLFGPEALPHKIVQESDFSLTGCWHHQLQVTSQTQASASWYLYLSHGKAVFSGSDLLSIGNVISTAERYVPRLRNSETKQFIKGLQLKLVPDIQDEPLETLPNLLNNLFQLNIVGPQEIQRALRLKILQDFDEFLFDYAGQASFLPNSKLADQLPNIGFDLQELLAEAQRRRIIWNNIKTLIPSTDSQLVIKNDAIQSAKLATQHKQKLNELISYGGTLSSISTALGQDTLEIARGLAQLVHKGLLAVQSAAKRDGEVWIIDDSPQILHQFQRLVSSWGYQVRSHSDAASAVEAMMHAKPKAIFLDVNMPKLSGFDLLKQIRRQSSLANVPLIMLTGEKTLSNNWKARWSGCKFLSKPLSAEEIPDFTYNLRMLLETEIV
ncbi:response regulator [Oscillatoria sp. CS-180]|uniref:response regulator n=1 Tax=Oscillatoria sp. CS-180 TaxID=3021720 RepID=UPI00232C3DFF|nr:response regulator [Oscillatoria sp. CS-180]MDB9525279.1 response regulator [Oscillatoria sp. CS-180]